MAASSPLMGDEEEEEEEGEEQQLSLLEQLSPELAEQVSTVLCIQ